MCLILLKFTGFSRPRGNEPNVLAVIRVNDYQNPSLSVRAESYPPGLSGLGLVIGNGDGGSSSTKTASAKRTPCFATFCLAFVRSQTISMGRAYTCMHS